MAIKAAGKKAETITKNEDISDLMDWIKRKGLQSLKTVESAVWKWEDGEPKYFKVLTAPVKNEARPGAKMEPATTLKVKDLDSGNHYTLIMNAVLLSGLTANYPGEEIIGKCFVSVRSAAAQGKTYKNFETHEVPDPE